MSTSACQDAGTLTLQVCETCRDPRKGAPACASTQALMAAGRQWSKASGRVVRLQKVSCLSGCAVGLTALIEDQNAAVRLHNVGTVAQWQSLLGEAEALLAGRASAPAQAHVLSRTDWSLWRDEASV